MTLTSRLSSLTTHKTHYRQTVLSVLVSAVTLWGCTTPAAEEFTFEQHEIVLGSEQHQTVLTGFFLGGDTANIATVTVDENDDRRFRIYAFENGAWTSIFDAALGPNVLFVDVANISGHDRLITYEHGRLNWFDPDSATDRPLVEITTNYNAAPEGMGYAGTGTVGPADEGEIPYIDITRDVNRDGRDDVVLPDVDGFLISIQLNDGSFTDPIKLGPPEPFRDAIAFGDTRKYGEVGISALTVPWYLSRVHEMDYDQDGRSDLVFWNEDHFDVYYQDARGLFSPVADPFSTDVPFDADGTYSTMFGFSGQSAFALTLGFKKKTERTVLCAARDLDGDGVTDLLTHTLRGRSVLRQRSRYEAHFGTPTPEGIFFARDAGTAIQPKGKAGALMEMGGYSSVWLEDFDGNGQIDILRGDIRMGARAIARALLGSSITMGAELYRMEDGVYPDKASTKRKITADIDITGGRDAGFFPFVLMGDVTGDGRSDFLVGKNREELHVFLGESGPELFTRGPQKVPVTLPGDERNTWLTHLNQDGKQDILMHFPSTTGPHRVTMLIAR